MAKGKKVGYPGVASGRNPTTEEIVEVGGDFDSRTIYVGAWVWASTLWAKMVQLRECLKLQ